MCFANVDYADCIIDMCLYLTCYAGTGVLGAQVGYEVTLSHLSYVFSSVAFVHAAY